MRFFVLPIFDGVIMDGHPIFQSWWIPATPASTTQNIGCPSIMTPSKMGKTKNLIFYSPIQDWLATNVKVYYMLAIGKKLIFLYSTFHVFDLGLFHCLAPCVRHLCAA